MTDKERQLREETFDEYRDQNNKRSDRMKYLRSLGLTEDTGEEGKPMTIRERVAAKIAVTFKAVDESLNAAGFKDPDVTLKIRELLLKDLTPFLKKDKSEVSMMDITTLGLTDESKIRGFLHRHGIDLDQPPELQYALAVLKEAVEFFDEEIANRHQQPIHKDLRKFAEAGDIYNLFRTAAGHGPRRLTPQACALLRIAMVIDYMNKDYLVSNLPQVQDQLKSDVHRHVRKVGNTLLYHSGNPQEKPIPLISAEARVKNRNRIIMKLLHKPSNSTSEVLDHIGYRFVTESASDTLRLIYQMFFDNNSAVLPSMNIRLDETTQRLVDPIAIMGALKDAKKAEELFAQLARETINHQDVETQTIGSNDNVHSSKRYRAIHFIVDFPVMINGNQQLFPIEIQFVDKTARKDNDELAPHHDYVEKQRAATTERVLGNNLLVNYQNRKKNGRKKHRSSP